MIFRKTLFPVALIAVASMAVSAMADTVSVNFQGNTGVPTVHTLLNPSDAAGVVSVAGWTNVSTSGTAPLTSLTSLADSTGAATSVNVDVKNNSTWTATANTSGGTAFADPDNVMANGLIVGAAGFVIELEMTGMDYFSSYDLYVYVPGDIAGRNYKASDGTTTYFYDSLTPPTASAITWVQATTTSDPATGNAAAANYVKFTGLSGNVTITVDGDPTGPGPGGDPGRYSNYAVSGFQIDGTVASAAIPEPSSFVLSVLGLAGLAGVRRRK